MRCEVGQPRAPDRCRIASIRTRGRSEALESQPLASRDLRIAGGVSCTGWNRRWSATAARAELRELAVDTGVRRRFAPHQLRHADAVELARRRGDQHHPAPARPYRPWDHQHLSAADRSKPDHRRRPLTPPADHLRDRRADPLTADVGNRRPPLQAGGSAESLARTAAVCTVSPDAAAALTAQSATRHHSQ